MATHIGNEGVIKVGTNVVAEVRSWSLDERAGTAEDTSMGDTYRTYKSGLNEWSGQLECWWDETDTNGQEALSAGAEVTLNLYPEGDTTGDKYYSGSAIITSVQVAGSMDNSIVSRTIQFTGNGVLNKPTVS